MSSLPFADRRQSPNSHLLSTHLWDLRSQAEAKLRCLTHLQQLLGDYERAMSAELRALKRHTIINDLGEIVTLTKTLQAVADDALAAAEALI